MSSVEKFDSENSKVVATNINKLADIINKNSTSTSLIQYDFVSINLKQSILIYCN